MIARCCCGSPGGCGSAGVNGDKQFGCATQYSPNVCLDGVLFIGLKDWYPPIYDCGACGYATCAEFTEATSGAGIVPCQSGNTISRCRAATIAARRGAARREAFR
jgi:hypothetical protein